MSLEKDPFHRGHDFESRRGAQEEVQRGRDWSYLGTVLIYEVVIYVD